MKRPHEYIHGRTLHIVYSLTHKDAEMRCLLAFGTNALRYAAKILATIEWGTQHWKMQEPFPMLPVLRWLCMPEQMQTTILLRGELPLPSPAIHLRNIRVWGPVLWAWMAVLLQFWQDHISIHLYGGWVWVASELIKVHIETSILGCHINPGLDGTMLLTMLDCG